MNVTVRRLTDADAPAASELWNGCVGRAHAPAWKPLDAQEFTDRFLREPRGVASTSLGAFVETKLVGFANGARRAGGEQGYITAVLVSEGYRGAGVGSNLLADLESSLGDVARYEVIFFNPVTLSWLIPRTEGHDHPNAPGVDVACDGYVFLKNHGYRDIAYQNSYYLPLASYRYPEDIRQRLRSLEADGIRVVRYDATVHSGLDELFDDLGNEEWREIVTTNCGPGGAGDPVLVVEHNGRALGFTGPTRVEPSGRGYFAGIGVHSSIRGRGAGKVLFSALCMELGSIGARFMTLFTGETNPARNIYEAAGFRIVKTWADMRKER